MAEGRRGVRVLRDAVERKSSDVVSLFRAMVW